MTAAPAPQAPTTVDLLVVLTRVEAKLDTATTGVADHEVRLRRLESRFWMAMGAASVLGAGGGAGIAQLIGR